MIDRFESPAVAKAVLFRLHQKELSGNRLSVEFSDSKVPHLYNNLDNQYVFELLFVHHLQKIF